MSKRGAWHRFEAEVAVVTADVPMGSKPKDISPHIRLLMLVNDVSLRNLIPGELAKGFGFFQSKPATAFSPVAITPDELGNAWRDDKVHRPLTVHWNGAKVGEPNAGDDMTFNFAHLIAHVAKTRNLRAGSIIGSGTVSNAIAAAATAALLKTQPRNDRARCGEDAVHEVRRRGSHRDVRRGWPIDLRRDRANGSAPRSQRAPRSAKDSTMSTKRSTNLPFSNPVGDSLELMKKMWGFAGLPGIPTPGNLASMAARVPQHLPNMFAPTLDVNELEKRIADLRAVEQWLELNASILRTTIQSLEVQRATIATLKGISGAMLAPMLGKPESRQRRA